MSTWPPNPRRTLAPRMVTITPVQKPTITVLAGPALLFAVRLPGALDVERRTGGEIAFTWREALIVVDLYWRHKAVAALGRLGA